MENAKIQKEIDFYLDLLADPNTTAEDKQHARDTIKELQDKLTAAGAPEKKVAKTLTKNELVDKAFAQFPHVRVCWVNETEQAYDIVGPKRKRGKDWDKVERTLTSEETALEQKQATAWENGKAARIAKIKKSA